MTKSDIEACEMILKLEKNGNQMSARKLFKKIGNGEFQTYLEASLKINAYFESRSLPFRLSSVRRITGRSTPLMVRIVKIEV